MRLYLSQPFAGYDVFSSHLSKLKELMISRGDTPIDPLDFEVANLSDTQIVTLDLSQIDLCNGIVCDLTIPNLGGGVWGEFYYAHGRSIPSVVICPEKAWSSPWIRHHASYRFDSEKPIDIEKLYRICKEVTE